MSMDVDVIPERLVEVPLSGIRDDFRPGDWSTTLRKHGPAWTLVDGEIGFSVEWWTPHDEELRADMEEATGLPAPHGYIGMTVRGYLDEAALRFIAAVVTTIVTHTGGHTSFSLAEVSRRSGLPEDEQVPAERLDAALDQLVAAALPPYATT